MLAGAIGLHKPVPSAESAGPRSAKTCFFSNTSWATVLKEEKRGLQCGMEVVVIFDFYKEADSA
jgi:hypothetical protein